MNQAPPRDDMLTMKIFKYLQDRPGEVCYLSDIAEQLGGNVGSIGGALGRMHTNTGYPITRVGRGAYVYRPNANGKPPVPEDKPNGQTIYPEVLKGLEKTWLVDHPKFTDINVPQFTFVGFMDELPIVKDKGSKLWACVALGNLLPKPTRKPVDLT